MFPVATTHDDVINDRQHNDECVLILFSQRYVFKYKAFQYEYRTIKVTESDVRMCALLSFYLNNY